MFRTIKIILSSKSCYIGYLENNNAPAICRVRGNVRLLFRDYYSIIILKESARKDCCSDIRNNVSSRRCKHLLIFLKHGGRKRACIARSKAILIYSRYTRHQKAFYQRDGARFYSGVLIDDSLPSPSASGFLGRSRADLSYSFDNRTDASTLAWLGRSQQG